MSVIITGIEKYKNCYSCPYNFYDLHCQITGGGIDRDDRYCDKPCPIKPVEGLIEKIQKQKQLATSGFMYDFIAYNKGLHDAIEIIKENCEVEE